MEKVLIIGDSIAMPGHGCAYENTWVCLIKRRYVNIDFITYLRRGLTTDILLSLGGEAGNLHYPAGKDALESYNPNYVIIQLGIVDCAPRYIRKNSFLFRLIFLMPPNIATLTYKVIKRIYKRKETRADVTLRKFKKNIKVYADRCLVNSVKRLVFIKINEPDSRIITKTPKLQELIKRYNKEIENLKYNYSFISVVDGLKAIEDNVYADGYHPTAVGHMKIFNDLLKTLSFQ